MKLILEHVVAETDLIHVMTFRSVSESTLPDYTAGSHIEFDLSDVGKRVYSLIDRPTASNRYTVAVQREDAGEGGSLRALGLANVSRSPGDLENGVGPPSEGTGKGKALCF